jgi:hypothetical protein
MARPITHRGLDRPGVALLIVIAMLALFATVGLSFVFYAEMQADTERFRRQAELPVDFADTLDTEKLFAFGLGQLIYGVDRTRYPSSSMIGYSLAESMYGIVGGTVPFNGIGKPHPDTTTLLAPQNAPFEGINVPYTYPDLNNPFLATIDSSGTITNRSFFRRKSLRPTTLPATDSTKPDEGDVRNVDSANGITGGYVNDAFWMDLGYPAITAKDGTKFKPLFAFTVLDLDGRVNLSVAGNYLADYTTANAITSRCGLGTFEINPAKVLTTNLPEIAQMFRGSTNPGSRFGNTGAGDTPDNAVTFAPTQFYSRIDYSGTSNSAPKQPSGKYSQFPTWGTWVDAAPQHTAGYDYYAARVSAGGAADACFLPANADGLLRWRDRGAAAMTNDMLRLLNRNLTPTTTGANTTPIGPAALNLVTPISTALDTAHIAPFFVGDGAHTYSLALQTDYPKNSVLTQTLPGGAQPKASDAVGLNAANNLSVQSRTAGELRRINLNRGFADMKDRQNMAKEIFDRLIRVTGALPPSEAPPFQPPTLSNTQYRATRWLAQLAVNMVDFIDDDDTMTVFNWNPRTDPATADANDFVFGVEQNRLLINEIYASADNDKVNDPTVNNPMMPNGTKYRINVWVELYNPMSALASNGGVATLSVNNKPRYRMLLAKDTTSGLIDDGTPSGLSPNSTGTPTNLFYDSPASGVIDWPANKSTVPPGDGSDGGAGFYLVGPPDDTFLNDRKPTWRVPMDHTSSGMTSKLIDMPAAIGSIPLTGALVLQRLADPTRDEQPSPTQPNYNPFITVDSYQNFIINKSIKYLRTTLVSPAPAVLGTLASRGRQQPLQGGFGFTAPTPLDTPPFLATGNEPKHTFGRQNSRTLGAPVAGDTVKHPFTAFYHFDRPLISTAELLHVAAVPAWQITKNFNVTPYTAYTPFSDPNSLLGRFFETVTVGDRSFNRFLNTPALNPTGIAGAGRHAIMIPGKINLNTIVDRAVLYALLDVQTDAASRSFYTQADVDFLWQQLKLLTDAGPIAGFSDYSLSGTTVTARKTLLDLFARIPQNTSGMTEYEKTEPLRKAMNNITFTSNAFAVWMTVGYFQVNAAGNPIQEIGQTENRQVRRRMFAVVDRSHLVLPDSVAPLTTITNANKGATTATLGAVTGSIAATGKAKVDYPTWTIRTGMALTIDKDLPTEETVMVTQLAGNVITVGGFTQQHGPNASVHLGGIRGPQVPLNAGTNNYILGYPGPQVNFDPRDYWYVVPHFSAID